MSLQKDIVTELQELVVHGAATDGRSRPLAIDGSGRLRVATGPVSLFYKNFGSASSATKALVTANPCQLLRVVFTNANAAVRYGLIIDKASIAAASDDTTVGQCIALPIPAGTTNNPGVLSLELGETHPLFRGLTWAVSTTIASFTDSATAGDHTVHIWYTTQTKEP